MTKRCPHCYRSYSDISINFCMEDGSVLTDSLDMPAVTEGHEIETLVRQGNEQVSGSKPREDWLENWQPAKTPRTRSEHPISSSPKTSVKPFAEWTSSD